MLTVLGFNAYRPTDALQLHVPQSVQTADPEPSIYAPKEPSKVWIGPVKDVPLDAKPQRLCLKPFPRPEGMAPKSPKEPCNWNAAEHTSRSFKQKYGLDNHDAGDPESPLVVKQPNSCDLSSPLDPGLVEKMVVFRDEKTPAQESEAEITVMEVDDDLSRNENSGLPSSTTEPRTPEGPSQPTQPVTLLPAPSTPLSPPTIPEPGEGIKRKYGDEERPVRDTPIRPKRLRRRVPGTCSRISVTISENESRNEVRTASVPRTARSVAWKRAVCVIL